MQCYYSGEGFFHTTPHISWVCVKGWWTFFRALNSDFILIKMLGHHCYLLIMEERKIRHVRNHLQLIKKRWQLFQKGSWINEREMGKDGAVSEWKKRSAILLERKGSRRLVFCILLCFLVFCFVCLVFWIRRFTLIFVNYLYHDSFSEVHGLLIIVSCVWIINIIETLHECSTNWYQSI